jgi:DNA-binding HxlR family transcriptional regulator
MTTDRRREAVSASADIIGAKWTALLIYDLAQGTCRFRELEQSCSGISSRTLAERLRALQRAGIVRRHSYPESPPRVEYELTDKGRDLIPILDAMTDFGRSWLVPAASGANTRRSPRVPQGRRDARDRPHQRQPGIVVAASEPAQQLDLDRVHRIDVGIAQLDRTA